MKSDVAKYLIIGVLIGISIMLLMGAGTGSTGRYQIYVIESWTVKGKEMFLILDTQTGVAKGFRPDIMMGSEFHPSD